MTLILIEPTAREIQVLVLVAEGYTNHQVAKELFVSAETVKTHISHLLVKLQARNRAHLVTQGVRQGWLTPSDGDRAGGL